MIEIRATGSLTTIQDQGRFGYAHLGVPRAGALDAPALARANELVGNPPAAAGLEITLAATEFVVRGDIVIAVTGAPAAVWVGRRSAAGGRPLLVPAGVRVRIGMPWSGARVYVAFGGGLSVPLVLGSRSTDTLSGLGPPSVRAGDVLPLGSRGDFGRGGYVGGPAGRRLAESGSGSGSGGWIVGRGGHADAPVGGGSGRGGHGVVPAGDESRDHEDWPPGEIGDIPAGLRTSPIQVRFTWGPRDDMFTSEARAAILRPYRVTPDSNRVGVRLAGTPLTRNDHTELPSEGIVLGAIQVTPDGQPLIFLADHPTTGGYPVIGVVDPTGVARIAQARPGDTVMFQADGSRHGPQRRSR